MSATGDYPRGKLNEHDKGSIQIAIALDEKNNTIIVDFGENVSWLGLDAFSAKKLGENLLEKANIILSKIK